MFKVLILQASHDLSDERTEYLIKDRLSFMRFLGLGLADTVPDANTIWTFREALTRARIDGKPAIEVLFERYDAALTSGRVSGAMGGQIIDASIVAAPKQRNTDGEKRDIKEGRIPEANGRTSPPSCARRTAMRAGRSNGPRRSQPRTARRASIWRSRPSATRTTSASTGGMG